VDVGNDVFGLIGIWNCIKNSNMTMIVEIKLLGVFDNLERSTNFFRGGIAFVNCRQVWFREL
jgi:hypothetical protein